MIILSAKNISRSFGDNKVLKDVSLTIQQNHRVGLVGANGSGKTTLLNLLAGNDLPDSGSINIAKGLRVGLLAQQSDLSVSHSLRDELTEVFLPLQELERRMARLESEMQQFSDDPDTVLRLAGQHNRLLEEYSAGGGLNQESTVAGMLTGLGFPRNRWDQPVNTLSGGERTRLNLGRLLLQKPDLLLLDEPTNHLDLPSLQWLEGYLTNYPGSVLVVSHDRYFLDAVCTDIAELIFGEIEQYEGNYSRYLMLRTERFEAREKAYIQQQKEIARQEAIIERLRSYNREKSIKRARSREKVLEKLERLDKPQDEKQIRFSFSVQRRPGNDIFLAENLSKEYDGRFLFQNLSLHVRAGDRIALIGANGVGKTTLLRLLLHQEEPNTGTIRYGTNLDIGYYDQHQADLHPDRSILDEISDSFPGMTQTEIRNVLGCFLFTDDDVFQPIRTLSGGERGRVSLTRLMLRRDNVLLLDEPTNHLDMDSREVLEEALEDYPGTIIAVSHDRYFINRIATCVAELTADGLNLYPGNYDDYAEKKVKMAFAPETPESSMTRTALDKARKRDRLSRIALKEAQETVRELEHTIAVLEKAILDDEASLGDPEIYENNERAREIALHLRDLRSKLDESYAMWESAATALDHMEHPV